MTLDALPTPLTALSVLESDGTAIKGWLTHVDPLARAQHDVGLITASPWSHVLGKVGGAAAEFLRIDIGDVLVAGWTKYGELIEAARRTRDATQPESQSESVDLAGRNVMLRQHPRVDVLWQGRTIASVMFEVVVDIRIRAVRALVRGGSIVSLSTGSGYADVSIETHGARLGPKRHELDPHLVIPLGSGIRLVD